MSADDPPAPKATKARHDAGKSRNGQRESFDRHSVVPAPKRSRTDVEPSAGMSVLPASAASRALGERQVRRSIRHVLVGQISGCRKPHHADGGQRNEGKHFMAILPNPDPTPTPVPTPPPFPDPKPMREPDPERLPDEEPVPNPDENDVPPKHSGAGTIQR
ncbi:hypothetical protein [Mesorhizobium captivum]